MSFPSAVEKLKVGWTAEDALWHAIRHDTEMGFVAVAAAVQVVQLNAANPVQFIQKRLAGFGREAVDAVLRWERRGSGIWVDFDPLSELGRQIARLMGTDAARPLMAQCLGMSFGFANCCKVIVSTKERDVQFTALEQIEWQANIDC